MKKLILVAARGEAKIFEKNGAKDIKWVKTLENKKGRSRESEFHSDMAGQSYAKFSGSLGPHRLEGKNDHATVVATKFAHKIARILKELFSQKSFDKAVLFASPKLLGLLKNETIELAKKVELEFVPKNIEKASREQLLAHI